MNAGQEPVEIFPVSLDMADGIITDFRAVVMPADAVEEEVPNPKAESAPEPVASQEPESQPVTEQNKTGHPALPPAVVGSTSLKGSATGSQTS